MRKGDPSCKCAENLSELRSIVGWKAERVNDELGDLVEEISKQNAEEVVWFVFAV